jgi:hypothetical protein
MDGVPEEDGMDADEGMDATGEGRLDGNAAGGILMSLFGRDMTANPTACSHCGTIHAMAAMHVYMAGPGMVIRCPACGGVILRVVETTTATFVDARGAAYVRIERDRR